MGEGGVGGAGACAGAGVQAVVVVVGQVGAGTQYQAQRRVSRQAGAVTGSGKRRLRA